MFAGINIFIVAAVVEKWASIAKPPFSWISEVSTLRGMGRALFGGGQGGPDAVPSALVFRPVPGACPFGLCGAERKGVCAASCCLSSARLESFGFPRPIPPPAPAIPACRNSLIIFLAEGLVNGAPGLKLPLLKVITFRFVFVYKTRQRPGGVVERRRPVSPEVAVGFRVWVEILCLAPHWVFALSCLACYMDQWAGTIFDSLIYHLWVPRTVFLSPNHSLGVPDLDIS